MAIVHLLAIAALGVASASSYTIADVNQYAQGFLIGLEQNPSKVGPCYSKVQALLNSTIAISYDVKGVIDGKKEAVFQLGIDVLEASSHYNALNGTCNLTGFVDAVESLFSVKGLEALEKRFTKNFPAIANDVATIAECEAHYYSCGEASGEIVRLLSAWQLNTPSPVPA